MATNTVKLTTVCPYCGEQVNIILTKKELKQLLKDMKLSPRAASIAFEQHIFRKLNRERGGDI